MALDGVRDIGVLIGRNLAGEAGIQTPRYEGAGGQVPNLGSKDRNFFGYKSRVESNS